jgi:uncharacterized protein YjbI with pentapeptide repeats
MGGHACAFREAGAGIAREAAGSRRRARLGSSSTTEVDMRHHAGRARNLAGALLFLACAGPAAARCGDAPGPKVDWTGCSKPQLMLGNDDLTGGVFSKAVLNFTDFAGAKLAGARFDEAELSLAKFQGADLAGANLVKAVAWRANFTKANLEKANFTTAQMSRSLFVQAKLAGANFSKSELNRSDLTGADLSGADLSKAELARVNFTDAKLSGVDFDDSNLSRARLAGLDLSGVKMAGAHLFRTQLRGANLSRATGLTQPQLDIACGGPDTRLPAGLNPPKGWPCQEDDE